MYMGFSYCFDNWIILMLPKCFTFFVNLENDISILNVFKILLIWIHRMIILCDFIKRIKQQNQKRKWNKKIFHSKLEKNQTTISLIIKWHNIFFLLYGLNAFIDEWHIRITLCPHSWREHVSTFRTFVWQIIRGLINVIQ